MQAYVMDQEVQCVFRLYGRHTCNSGGCLVPCRPPPPLPYKNCLPGQAGLVTFLPLYIHSYNNLVQQQHCCFMVSRPKQCNIDFSMRFLKDLNTCDNLP